MAAILYPLTMVGGLKDLSRMKYLWVVSLLGIAFVFLVMLIDSIMVTSEHDLPYIQTTFYETKKVSGNIYGKNVTQEQLVEKDPLGYGAFWDIISCICVFGSAYVCHYIAPKMFFEFTSVHRGESRPDRKQFVKFGVIVFMAFITAAAVFIAFGIVGMARFGDETLGNVLKSYGEKDGVASLLGGVPHWLISVCWVLIIVSISTTWVFAYNIMFDAFRDILHDTAERFTQKDPSSLPEGKIVSSVPDDSDARSDSFINSKIFNFSMTAVFLGITLVTGSTVDSLATINFI